MRRFLRRLLPRRSHPILDQPIVDDAGAIEYARTLERDPDGHLPFVRERYREGIRWRQVLDALGGGRRVLDLGCGNGAVAMAVAAAGGRVVVGLDAMVNPLAPRGMVVAGDGLALPLADRSIDVVLCLETIEHIPPRSLAAFAGEIRRVLADGGMIVMTTPPRWRYALRRDPHFGIPGLLLLPPAAQRAVAAKRGFGQPHHYVGRIYSSVAQIAKVFPGFAVEVLSRSRAPRRWFWDALVLRQPPTS